MTWTFTKGLLGVPDILFGDSTTNASQLRRSTSSTAAATDIQYIDDAVIPLSTASKTSLGLAGTKHVADGFAAVAAGVGIAKANLSVYGLTRSSVTTATPQALDVSDPVYARIVSAAIYNALTGSAQTPDYGNAFVTRYESQLAQSLSLGSGKDGHGKLGAIAASATAPASLDVATAGLLTNATGYKYKIAAYNLAGAIVASSASVSTGAITAKQVTMTLPALPTNAMGWRIYRETGGAGNYEYIDSAVLGFNYTETASDAKRYLYTDNVPTANASLTAPGSDTTDQSATLSGLYQFLTLTTVASDAITVDSTGVYAGYLDIRVQGIWTGAETAWTITGTGANAVNLGFARETMGVGTTGVAMFVPLVYGTTTPAITSLSGLTSGLAYGWGADCSRIKENRSGFGTLGGGTTGGNGNYGGALVRIWAYATATRTIGGTITVNGGAGVAGTTNGGGGGGGAGGLQDIGCFLPWADVGTRNSIGGVGGAGAGTGRGGAGAGGGGIIRRNCFSTSGATSSVAAGAHGTNGGTTDVGGHGGGHFGTGGCNNGTAQTVATAGQQFALNGFFDPSAIFAA